MNTNYRKNSNLGKNKIRFRYKEKDLKWRKKKLKNSLRCFKNEKDRSLKLAIRIKKIKKDFKSKLLNNYLKWKREHWPRKKLIHRDNQRKSERGNWKESIEIIELSYHH